MKAIALSSVHHHFMEVEQLHKFECKKEQSYANDNKAMQMLAKTADYCILIIEY